ncbi:LPXTG cell wall anchor domain-containing protein [Agreia sp. PsM10]|uniref:LPXTG cell wall anchor domain-containing protein n=1 Tax=Agreia sp. PsM10 TaxID=3030533 RepID=UPI00263BB571|nr:LPXTG cell wall anchor domain-containing protein [Agreia sp. PsM10]MDN4642069.1 LPXTG cell wall anchor domain-containing protein [Agreia sp. PsM10]
MSRTILSRLGAGLVATALVAGGSLLVAAPASAANDIVTPNSVVENTWGTEGGLTVSGTGTAGDDLVVDITDNNVGEFDYFVNDSKDVEVGADGTYTVTFFWNEEQNDFTRLPQVGDTPFAYIQNVTEGSEVEDIFLPIAVTAFVPAAQNVVVDPICLSGDAVRDPGVTVFATGFGQGEEVTYVVTDAAGNVVPGDDEPITADETGSVGPAPLSLFSSAGNIPDGVYTITFSSATVAATAGLITVGNCEVPVAPVEPAAVAAAPQLANTGSSDAGILVGGSALLLLVGAALVVARRRQNADA